MRKNFGTSLDPGSEESKKEQKIISSSIISAQAELVTLGDLKKKLEKEIEDKKAGADKEVEPYIEKANEKLRLVNTQIDTHEKNRDAILAGNQKLKDDGEDLTKRNDVLKATNEIHKAEKKNLTLDIQSLINKKSNLEKEIFPLSNEKGDLKKVINSLSDEKTVLNEKLPELRTSKAELEKNISLSRETLKGINKEIGDANESKTKVAISLSEAEKELEDIRGSIKIARQELNETITKNKAEEEAIKEKTSNLAKLEERVDEKLRIFQAYKEKFTVDEFTKMKINPNLV